MNFFLVVVWETPKVCPIILDTLSIQHRKVQEPTVSSEIFLQLQGEDNIRKSCLLKAFT
jgi:hypothetical protein